MHKALPAHFLDRVAFGAELPGRFSRGGSRGELPLLRPLYYLLHLPLFVLARLEVYDDPSEFGQFFKRETPRVFHERYLVTTMHRLHILKHLVVRVPVAERIDRQGLIVLPIPPVTAPESYSNSLHVGKPVGI